MVKDKFYWFPFEPGAWLQDPELSRCSAAARGVWIDILCLMFQSDERGVLVSCGDAWTVEEAARALRGDTEVNLSSIQELLRCGVMRSRKDGALYCSRMIRERNLSETRAKVGRKGGLAKAKQTASKTSSKHPSNALTVTSKYNSSKKGKEIHSALEFMTSDVLKTDAFTDAWSDWTNHRKEIRKPLTPTSIKQQIRKLESWGEPRAIAAIRHSICGGWQGIFEDKNSKVESEGSDEFKKTLDEIAERKAQGEVPK